MYRILKDLSHCCASYGTTPLGNFVYVLESGVAKYSLVGRGYIRSWRKDCKAESNEEKGEVPSFLYITPVSPLRHDTCERLGSNWIWLKSPLLFWTVLAKREPLRNGLSHKTFVGTKPAELSARAHN